MEIEVSMIVSHPKNENYVGSIAIIPDGKQLFCTWGLSNKWEKHGWLSVSNNCRFILQQSRLTKAKTYRGILKIKVQEGS